MAKPAHNYIVRHIVKRILALLLFLLGAMGKIGRREIFFFLFYFGSSLLSCLVLYILSPATLSVTQSFNKDTHWNNTLPCILTLLKEFIVYLAAGLGYLYLKTDIWFYLGLVLFALSKALHLWALISNPFFMLSGSELPTELCRTGPYKYVRHPAYSSSLIWCFSICLIFPHIYVAIIALGVMMLTISLTYLEDRMLNNGITNYASYSDEVDFMLIPYLW